MPDTLVGKTGRVLVRVKGEEVPGEVELLVDGAPQTWIAYAKDRIEAGSTVLVVGDRGHRHVDVVPWLPPWEKT